jgi:hypothetical protein
MELSAFNDCSNSRRKDILPVKATRRLLMAFSCLLCLVVIREGPFLGLEGTEFSGGALTGPLLNMYFVGLLLFALALLLAFFLPRISAVIAVFACLLAFPLDLYFIAPNIFRRLFTKMIWEGPPVRNFVWNWHAILGVVTIAFTVSISYWNVRTGRQGANPKRG